MMLENLISSGEQIHTKQWTNRDLIRTLFGLHSDLIRINTYKVRFKSLLYKN